MKKLLLINALGILISGSAFAKSVVCRIEFNDQKETEISTVALNLATIKLEGEPDLLIGRRAFPMADAKYAFLLTVVNRELAEVGYGEWLPSDTLSASIAVVSTNHCGYKSDCWTGGASNNAYTLKFNDKGQLIQHKKVAEHQLNPSLNLVRCQLNESNFFELKSFFGEDFSEAGPRTGKVINSQIIPKQ